MHKSFRLLTILAIICVGLFLNLDTAVADEKRAVIVVVDEFTWKNIENYELTNLERIIKEGGISLLSTGTANTRIRNNTFLTIGLGAPAVGGGDAGLAFNADENHSGHQASELYQAWYGMPAKDNAIVHLGFSEIVRTNPAVNRTALGDVLRENNINIAVFGNADYSTQLDRNVVNLVVGSAGTVQAGNISKDTTYKYKGFEKTDYQVFGESFNDFNNNSLLVIQLGDLYRLNQVSSKLLPEVHLAEKENILREIDDFLGRLLYRLNSKTDLLLIMSPTPAASELPRRNLLTPLIIWGSDYTEGLLTSPSTKRPGIVSNTDIAPTILHHFNIPNYNFMGRTIVSSEVNATVSQLTQFNDKLVLIYNLRPPVMKAYIFGQIAVVLFVLLSIFTKLKIKKHLSIVLFGLLVLPTSFLLAGPFTTSTISFSLFNLATVIAYIGIIVKLEKIKKLSGLLAAVLVPVLLLTFDLLNNSFLIKQSILGYDAIAGARYYGLGNEYMGILIGATIASGSLLYELYPRINKAIVFASLFIILVIIGHPGYGTNVGGTITAAVGFGLFALFLIREKITLYHFGFVSLSSMTMLTLFFLMDFGKAVETQSHIGRTASLIREEGIQELANIAVRKWDMNLRLIKYTNWTKALLVFILSLIILYFRPKGILSNVMKKYRILSKGFGSILAASFITILVNDSGIVAAATMMIYGAIPLIYLTLQEMTV